MNDQEKMNLFKQLLTLACGLAVGAGYLTATQSATLINGIMVGVPAIVAVGSVIWSVYSHWNMKKVPETALVVKAGTPVAPNAIIHDPGIAAQH